MKAIQQIETRRNTIMRELLAIRSLRKGNVNEQWFPVVRGGKKTTELRGPYYVHTYKVGKKTASVRLKDENALKQARADTEEYRRFKTLCGELEELTRQLGELERQQGTGMEKLKKGLKSRSNRARK